MPAASPNLTLYLSKAGNLSGLASASTARSNLGLGTAATLNTGTTNGTIPLIGASDLLAAAILPAMVGDSGSGGTKGAVPAPASGDAAASKFLKADGTWATVSAGVSSSRLISTTSPLSGGGDLSADRTLSIDSATTSAAGAVELATVAEANAGTDTTRAVTSDGLLLRLPASPGTAYIGCDLTGNARGANALDLQSSRTDATYIATGARSVLYGYRNKGTQADDICLGSGNTQLGGSGPGVLIGFNNTVASGGNAFHVALVGYGNSIASGGHAYALIGNGNQASGGASSSVAIGYANTVANGSNVAVGQSIVNATASCIEWGIANTNKLRWGASAGFQFIATSSTTADRVQGAILPSYVVNTDASRTSRLVYQIWDTAAREAMRMEASGTAAMIGFLGADAIARPSAYTQTYSTADKTHANATAAALTVTDGAGTNDGTIGAITADASVIAAVQELADQINKLIADHADTKQLANSIIDDLQSLGLFA